MVSNKILIKGLPKVKIKVLDIKNTVKKDTCSRTIGSSVYKFNLEEKNLLKRASIESKNVHNIYTVIKFINILKMTFIQMHLNLYTRMKILMIMLLMFFLNVLIYILHFIQLLKITIILFMSILNQKN
jgi:hypothetical protein